MSVDQWNSQHWFAAAGGVPLRGEVVRACRACPSNAPSPSVGEWSGSSGASMHCERDRRAGRRLVSTVDARQSSLRWVYRRVYGTKYSVRAKASRTVFRCGPLRSPSGSWRPIFTRVSVHCLLLVEGTLELRRFESGLLAVERHYLRGEWWEGRWCEHVQYQAVPSVEAIAVHGDGMGSLLLAAFVFARDVFHLIFVSEKVIMRSASRVAHLPCVRHLFSSLTRNMT